MFMIFKMFVCILKRKSFNIIVSVCLILFVIVIVNVFVNLFV